MEIDERELGILKKLDEDFRDHFSQSESYVKRPDEEKLRVFLESNVVDEVGLFELLMQQAKEQFGEGKRLKIAEAIIGNLDESGLFTTSVADVAVLASRSKEEVEGVLKEVQTFEPPGIASRDLRDCLLEQLRRCGKSEGLAYQVVDQSFDDLVHNRILAIKKKLGYSVEDIEKAIYADIAKLDLHPGSVVSKGEVGYVVPDVTIVQEDEQLSVAVNDDAMPRLCLNSRYVRMLDDPEIPKETKDFIKHKVLSAKWLMRNLLQRNTTLERIAEMLIKVQREFFLGDDGKLVPLTMKTVATELEVHESTIARAVANKYIATPKGLFPLRFFFTSGLDSQKGEEVSSNTVRDLIKEIISKEDKRSPLSDEQIAKKIEEQGVHCARRTVAKYRGLLKLGNAQQRRKY